MIDSQNLNSMKIEISNGVDYWMDMWNKKQPKIGGYHLRRCPKKDIFR